MPFRKRRRQNLEAARHSAVYLDEVPLDTSDESIFEYDLLSIFIVNLYVQTDIPDPRPFIPCCEVPCFLAGAVVAYLFRDVNQPSNLTIPSVFHPYVVSNTPLNQSEVLFSSISTTSLYTMLLQRQT